MGGVKYGNETKSKHQSDVNICRRLVQQKDFFFSIIKEKLQ